LFAGFLGDDSSQGLPVSSFLLHFPSKDHSKGLLAPSKMFILFYG
jgi:hypothetical protein